MGMKSSGWVHLLACSGHFLLFIALLGLGSNSSNGKQVYNHQVYSRVLWCFLGVTLYLSHCFHVLSMHLLIILPKIKQFAFPCTTRPLLVAYYLILKTCTDVWLLCHFCYGYPKETNMANAFPQHDDANMCKNSHTLTPSLELRRNVL